MRFNIEDIKNEKISDLQLTNKVINVYDSESDIEIEIFRVFINEVITVRVYANWLYMHAYDINKDTLLKDAVIKVICFYNAKDRLNLK